MSDIFDYTNALVVGCTREAFVACCEEHGLGGFVLDVGQKRLFFTPDREWGQGVYSKISEALDCTVWAFLSKSRSLCFVLWHQGNLIDHYETHPNFWGAKSTPGCLSDSVPEAIARFFSSPFGTAKILAEILNNPRSYASSESDWEVQQALFEVMGVECALAQIDSGLAEIAYHRSWGLYPTGEELHQWWDLPLTPYDMERYHTQFVRVGGDLRP